MATTVPDVELHFSTNDATIDRVMRGYVAAFEAAFPGRLRCFVVAGGHAEGTATPLSDLDAGPVFRGPLSDDERHRANALIRACSDLARIHFDAGAGADDRLYRWHDTGDGEVSDHAVERRYYAKLAYRVIWGEEFRDPILLPPIEYWARACFFGPQHMGSVAYFIAATRNPTSAHDPAGFILTHPVDHPDRQDTFFGYARHPLTARDGTTRLTTRMFVRTALAGANALLAWKAKEFIASKADVAATYRRRIGGPWADLVAAVDCLCRVELCYRVPEGERDRRRLTALCADMPAFENFILAQYRTFMLEQLAIANDKSTPLSDGEWLPAELAGWLLERSPDDVQVLGAAGDLPRRAEHGHAAFAARPCLQRWAVAQLGRVVFPGDAAVIQALRTLSGETLRLVRDEARASLGRVA